MSAIAIDPLQTLKLARVFPAPRERVFRAWTEPAELMRWWGPVGFTTPSAEVDLRVGGKYRIAMRRPDGGVHFVKGDRKSTRLNSSHSQQSRMPSSA